ncbi:hypothetical protein GIB67_008699 [Kingdonia uniflora]|uniref:Protein kinase domain-containing protein n=1 Tax=Kingdonia uniflora TaxID=39325 RepID=A0A7J7M5D5_9MAGN|nr:hypothetical protein GIB67_008699 [Kingdonia uniflora]
MVSQLSTSLSGIDRNIREAHVFSTTDGYSLDVLMVDEWPAEDTDGLLKAVEKAVTTSERLWSASSPSNFGIKKVLCIRPRFGNLEIDKRKLNVGEKVAFGSCGDLYRRVYLGQDFAIKILKSKHVNEASEEEFSQELTILRWMIVKGEDIVRRLDLISPYGIYIQLTEKEGNRSKIVV